VEGRGPVNFKPEIAQRANKKTIWPTSYWNLNNFPKTNCHLIFLRYADVLLVYAEACNELGETGEALAKLELVRDRARKSQHPDDFTVDLPQITETGKDKLRELIWQERRIELALEGHRFFDLIRAEKTVAGYATKALREGHGKTSFDLAQHSTFYIPQTQIDISQGVLTQNK